MRQTSKKFIDPSEGSLSASLIHWLVDDEHGLEAWFSLSDESKSVVLHFDDEMLYQDGIVAVNKLLEEVSNFRTALIEHHRATELSRENQLQAELAGTSKG